MGLTYAPSLTIGFVIFNLILFLVVGAFATDGVQISSNAQNIQNSLGSINQSASEGSMHYSDVSFISKIWITFSNLPSWFNTLIITIEALLVIVIILAWLRGL